LELTLESAFSTGGLVGHTSYLLLVASMLMRDMTRLRILVIASALVAITYDTVWLKDPIGVFWETLLVTVNVVQIGLIWNKNRRTQFNADEQALVNARLSRLDPHDARAILNMGFWADGAAGTELTRQNRPVRFLVYLLSGQVDILCDDQKVGTCVPGNFIGEMSLLDNSNASATAVVAAPSRYWMIPTDEIRKMRIVAPELAEAIEMGIAQDLKTKILALNARPKAIG
jgi:hypothetical protein